MLQEMTRLSIYLFLLIEIWNGYEEMLYQKRDSFETKEFSSRCGILFTLKLFPAAQQIYNGVIHFPV